MKLKVKRTNSLLWLLEPLEEDPLYARKKMFGCEAAYLGSKLVAVLADTLSGTHEPWYGLLVPTDREHHPALQKDFPALKPHPILGKWLYLSQTHPEFEAVATKLIERVRRADPRIGVESGAKARAASKTRRRS